MLLSVSIASLFYANDPFVFLAFFVFLDRF